VTPHDETWVGRRLAGGRYAVVAALGEGGMAMVYRAVDRHLEQDVVIKTPHAHLVSDLTAAARFTREIRSLVQLSHPHVVKILDVGTEGVRPFIVLQYCPGGSLRDRQGRHRQARPQPLPPDAFSGWLEDVASALDFIHQQGYLHRDVKPENILFDAHGHAYVSDFGLAKALWGPQPPTPAGRLTATGVGVGTPAYMAPELIQAAPCDGRVDQYALAVLLYELLSGRTPFEGTFPAAVLTRHVTDEPPPLHELCPTVSPTLAAAVTRGLAKDPAARYPTCMALARAVLEGREAAGAIEVHTQVAGTWYRRPGREPERETVVVARTPGLVRLPPGSTYEFRVDVSATDAQLTDLGRLATVPDLRGLRLSWCDQLTDAAVDHVTPLRQLDELHLRGCERLTDAGLARLAALPDLELLDLGACTELTDAGLVHLAPLTHLASLRLSGCSRLTDTGLAQLRGLTHLKALYLNGCEQLTDAGLAHLEALSHLRELSIGSPRITDVGVLALRGLTQLQALDVGDCVGLADAALHNLAGMTQLEKLILYRCERLTDAGLQGLCGLVHLEWLDLGWCERITDAGLGCLAALPHLRSLWLSGCKGISDEGLARLKDLTRLEYLDLRGCPQLSDAGLRHLLSLARLRSLVVDGCKRLTDDGLRRFRAAAPACRLSC
jgi:tRNA A-37 threonylcarbamoyl transferase component Bud32